jgi:hypothetical protein
MSDRRRRLVSRIAAYILHPVGWAIDVLIMRPAHWLVSKEPLDEVFGHED